MVVFDLSEGHDIARRERDEVSILIEISVLDGFSRDVPDLPLQSKGHHHTIPTHSLPIDSRFERLWNGFRMGWRESTSH
jgi:hypothetical protein